MFIDRKAVYNTSYITMKFDAIVRTLHIYELEYKILKYVNTEVDT